MAGIYIHIPFCSRKCHYCNFFSLASKRNRESFLLALEKEILLRNNYLSERNVNTIYFGGGTPSVFPPDKLQFILEKLSLVFTLLPASSLYSPTAPNYPEITLEVNPEDVNLKFVAGLRHTWFNRLSVGVQSFSGTSLTWLNRAHTSEQSLSAVKRLQDAGYSNISIDLIYGIPGLTDALWEETIKTAVSLKIPHISAYALTVEPHTALDLLIRKGKVETPSEESAVRHFRMIRQSLREEGFLHYEISNFSLPQFESKHNSNYWNGEHYLGLGPAAHSFDGKSRQWNTANLAGYLATTGSVQPSPEIENLTMEQQYNEYVMTSLRTMWGCDSHKIMTAFGFQAYTYFLENASSSIRMGLLQEKTGIFCLTENGQLFADKVSSELFMV